MLEYLSDDIDVLAVILLVLIGSLIALEVRVRWVKWPLRIV